MKTFRTGLVVGKFAPLHLGHVALITRALDSCDEVAVITYSNPELPIAPPALRDQWLAECFPTVRRLVATNERLGQWFAGTSVPPVLPPNDAPDDVHRHFVALLCQQVLNVTPDAVFSSEAYGPGFAARLTECFRRTDPDAKSVAHVMVDRERLRVPISATQLRQETWQNWNFLPPPVQRSLVRRVALLGGESSGKSTLAESLATALGTQHVAEYGRELWEQRGGALEFDDLAAIAREQIRREEEASRSARGYLFCDTSPLTTLFYSQQLFGRVDPELVEAAARPYDEVVLCMPDFDFVQDGTRQGEDFRMAQHAWYESELSVRGIPFRRAHGPLADRITTISRILCESGQ